MCKINKMAKKPLSKIKHDEQRQAECGPHIVGDGKGIEEDLKEMDKKKEEGVGSLKMKRKPPKELMKGGIRDRPLFSWIRILGLFSSFKFFSFNSCSLSLFQVPIDSPLSLFHAQWWLPSGGCSSLASWPAASPSCAFHSVPPQCFSFL